MSTHTLTRSQLVRMLNEMPDVEVGTEDGMVYHAELSYYEDDEGEHPYIQLDLDDE